MVLPIDKVAANAISGSVENTAALLYNRVELSLFKVEAPVEFHVLGAALSPQRRDDAEKGNHHQTARKLGALFEQVLPPIPNLVKAYGTRVSEISNISALNPKGSRKHGVFANHVGVDGTSIWAAATSGVPAIAIHLLACMLARAFVPSEAIAIWDQIVDERKKSIIADAQEGMTSSIYATLPRITRDDLTKWDASARAWLQTADEAEAVKTKQLMLILDNVRLPVNVEKTTYNNVLGAWKTAMTAVEKLLSGQPQRVFKGAVLLGLTVWHLFPDLLVLDAQTTHVPFHDELFATGGRLTIGLENVTQGENEGIYWSLALSHLRYYGGDVVVRRAVGREKSRFTIPEAHLLALGSVLASWGSFGSDEVAVANFFVALWDCLGRVQSSGKHKRLADFLMSSSSWLSILVNASKVILGPPSMDRDSALKIIKLGRRRGHAFLVKSEHTQPPLFGLSSIFNATLFSDSALNMNAARSPNVAMMRVIASLLRLHPNECIIRISPRENQSGFEYATALPHSACSPEVEKSAHHRWIETARSDILGCNCALSPVAKEHTSPHFCTPTSCSCYQKRILCTPSCHKQSQGDDECQNRLKEEVCHYVPMGLFGVVPIEYANNGMKWNINVSRATNRGKPSPNFLITLDSKNGPTSSQRLQMIRDPDEDSICGCFFRENEEKVLFNVLAGDIDDVALFVKASSGFRKRQTQIVQALSEVATNSWLDVKTTTENLQSEKTNPEMILGYMIQLSTKGRILLPRFAKSLQLHTYDAVQYMKSLNALSLATEVYKQLPRATVAADLIYQPLHRAHWVPKSNLFPHRIPLLRRASFFACIAMFESGVYNLRPTDLSDVMAISARNSIYISNIMLRDPSDISQVNDMTLVLGNVGLNGMVLMVSPQEPRVRPLDLEHWEHVEHLDFDKKIEDCFSSTSLHLSFTDCQLPLNVGHRSIDNDVTIVETVVSVYDERKWVADIDALTLYQVTNKLLRRFQSDPNCSHTLDSENKKMTSLQSWEELLDAPEDLGRGNVGVVKAYSNWQARLASACVSVQKGFQTVILPRGQICWKCCRDAQWQWQPSDIEVFDNVPLDDDNDHRTNKSSSDAIGDRSGSSSDSGDSEDSDSTTVGVSNGREQYERRGNDKTEAAPAAEVSIRETDAFWDFPVRHRFRHSSYDLLKGK